MTFLGNELGLKRLGLLNELDPGASRYALLVNPRKPTTELLIVELRAAAARSPASARSIPPSRKSRGALDTQ
jgi:hypothetical protein